MGDLGIIWIPIVILIEHDASLLEISRVMNTLSLSFFCIVVFLLEIEFRKTHGDNNQYNISTLAKLCENSFTEKAPVITLLHSLVTNLIKCGANF